MKQTIYYLTITAIALSFLGCTPKQLSQNTVIKTTTIPTPSLGTVVQSTKAPEELIEPPLEEAIETTTLSSKAPDEEPTTDDYSHAPKDYRTTIRAYLSKKTNPNDTIKYVFSRPYKAEKNNKAWRGWAVDVDMLKRNGEGKVLRNKPYTILFDGSSIVEDLSDDDAKDVVRVVY